VTKVLEEGYRRGGGAFGPKGKNITRRQRKLLDGDFNYFLSGNMIRIIKFWRIR